MNVLRRQTTRTLYESQLKIRDVFTIDPSTKMVTVLFFYHFCVEHTNVSRLNVF